MVVVIVIAEAMLVVVMVVISTIDSKTLVCHLNSKNCEVPGSDLVPGNPLFGFDSCLHSWSFFNIFFSLPTWLLWRQLSQAVWEMHREHGLQLGHGQLYQRLRRGFLRVAMRRVVRGVPGWAGL